MYDKDELCEKIRSVFPEIGACGIDVKVNYDERKQAWIVDLTQGEHHLQTHLEPQDAALCMEGKQCVHLGAQISQLETNINKV